MNPPILRLIFGMWQHILPMGSIWTFHMGGKLGFFMKLVLGGADGMWPKRFLVLFDTSLPPTTTTSCSSSSTTTMLTLIGNGLESQNISMFKDHILQKPGTSTLNSSSFNCGFWGDKSVRVYLPATSCAQLIVVLRMLIYPNTFWRIFFVNVNINIC